MFETLDSETFQNPWKFKLLMIKSPCPSYVPFGHNSGAQAWGTSRVSAFQKKRCGRRVWRWIWTPAVDGRVALSKARARCVGCAHDVSSSFNHVFSQTCPLYIDMFKNVPFLAEIPLFYLHIFPLYPHHPQVHLLVKLPYIVRFYIL